MLLFESFIHAIKRMVCLLAPYACVPDIENCGVEVVVPTTSEIGSSTMYTDYNNKRAGRRSIVASVAEGKEVVLEQFLLHQEMVVLVQLLAPDVTALLPALVLSSDLVYLPELVSFVAKFGLLDLCQLVLIPVEQSKHCNLDICRYPNHSQTVDFSSAVLRSNKTRRLRRCQPEAA